MINFHAAPGRNLSGTLTGRRQREDEKIAIVSNLAVRAAAGLGRRSVESFPRALP